jgi:histidinol phosphatase-like enzyme (inositol monophosphatase family)
MDLEPYRAFLIELAERSGDFLRPYFGNAATPVEIKADQSPVTAADRGAEQLLRRLIQKKFPSHGIIGEEFGNERPEAEFVWVLDPIDGTKAFLTACPLFGTLIALMHQGRPVLGAIHQPVLRQLLLGDGTTAELNGRPVRVRPCPDLASAVLLTSDPFNPGKYRNGAAFDALARQARFARTWGDCYGYLLVATGWADIMTDPIVNPWDIQAIIPIIRGAGGTITDWSGADPVAGDSLVAAHPHLHPQVIAALNAAPTRP